LARKKINEWLEFGKPYKAWRPLVPREDWLRLADPQTLRPSDKVRLTPPYGGVSLEID